MKNTLKLIKFKIGDNVKVSPGAQNIKEKDKTEDNKEWKNKKSQRLKKEKEKFTKKAKKKGESVIKFPCKNV